MPLFFTIFSTIELEVGKHILSAIAMSSKIVPMTDNVVVFCVSEMVPTRLWGGGHKISDILNRGGRKILYPFDRGGSQNIAVKICTIFEDPPCR